ncbi:acyl-CoA N-acyltransferase [Rhodocollybia butyracea]|uniref:Acyl-CoA N-acyltransferase n=1 Tax=Rhodocollybia butyracea TaxID=206335 RepID=A0A9P5QAD8_9AGAR|nr:acyl-CoA N-acyltransferase [Rhodocollybia butyracea]
MFETTPLRLRAVKNADYEKLHDLWNDARVQKTLSSTFAVPLDDKFEEKLRTWVSTGLMYCIIETKDNADWVGAEILVDYSFRELGLHRLTLSVFSHNEAAFKLYKKAGFIEEGVLRKTCWSDEKWQDAFAMAILDEDWAALSLS